MLDNICPPALIYIIFSLTQIIIDLFKGLYNTAFFKTIIMIFVSLLLNILCYYNLGIISWILVFIPFIFMSIIVAILLFVFGLDPATGKLKLKCPQSTLVHTKTGNLIYSTNTNIISNTNTNTNIPKKVDVNYIKPIPFRKSDPQYY